MSMGFAFVSLHPGMQNLGVRYDDRHIFGQWFHWVLGYYGETVREHLEHQPLDMYRRTDIKIARNIQPGLGVQYLERIEQIRRRPESLRWMYHDNEGFHSGSGEELLSQFGSKEPFLELIANTPPSITAYAEGGMPVVLIGPWPGSGDELGTLDDALSSTKLVKDVFRNYPVASISRRRHPTSNPVLYDHTLRMTHDFLAEEAEQIFNHDFNIL